MNCNEARRLRQAHHDAELDAVHSLEFEEHLKTCAACSCASQNLDGLRSSLRADEMYFRAPLGLERRVLANLRHEDDGSVRGVWRFPRFWLQLAGAGALALVLGLVLVASLNHTSATDRLAQEVTSSHVRSLMAGHLMDVASTDQHTVKPWFDGRIDFAPPVVNLADRGFPLIGGRLDYLENRPVAALVYQRQKHIINLFIWPAEDAADIPEKISEYHGYNLIHWRAAGMTFWAVSDLNRGELGDFAEMIRNQAGPAVNP